MKKLVYFIPAIIATVFYLFLSFVSGFGAIHWGAWVCVASLFLSGVLMSSHKWWGCLFGVVVGGILIYMGTQYTGQIINEMPIGIIVSVFYGIIGFYIYKKKN